VHPELNFVQIVNAAVSPCYNNNPSYGILEFNDDLTIKSHTSRFFQLTEYEYFGSETWINYSSVNLGINLNQAASVRARTTSMLYNY